MHNCIARVWNGHAVCITRANSSAMAAAVVAATVDTSVATSVAATVAATVDVCDVGNVAAATCIMGRRSKCKLTC